MLDAAALAQFQQQWGTYRKLVEGDCLAQREVGAILRQTLSKVFTQPFSFLDIACGDASMMKAALDGTKVRHYHGIDLSQPALQLAAANLRDMPFAVDQTTAISWKRCSADPSMPTRRGAACRFTTCRPTTSYA